MGHHINSQGTSMHLQGKAIGSKAITNNFGSAEAMPDFFTAFLNSILIDPGVQSGLENGAFKNAADIKDLAQTALPKTETLQQAASSDLQSPAIVLPFSMVQNPIIDLTSVSTNTDVLNASDSINEQMVKQLNLAQARGEIVALSVSSDLDASAKETDNSTQSNIKEDWAASKGTAELELGVLDQIKSLSPNSLENSKIDLAINRQPDALKSLESKKPPAPGFSEDFTKNSQAKFEMNFAQNNMENAASLDLASHIHALHKTVLTEKQTIKDAGQSHNQIVDFANSIRELQNTENTQPIVENKGEVIAAKINDLAQIMVEKAQNGERKFFVRLDPPELGKIEVELKFGVDNKIDALIRAQTPEALSELMRQARDMVEALNQAGFNLKNDNLNFSLNDSNQNGTNPEQFKKRKNQSVRLDSNEIEIGKEIKTQKWQRAGISLVA